MIRSWRDEAVELWHELFREPPEHDEDEDPEDQAYEYWSMAREGTQVDLAISAMDVDFAREVDDICWRNMAEVRIRDRQGDLASIASILERAIAIGDPGLRAKAVNGVCQGVKTPAHARDLGLLGHALSIPGDSEEHQHAVSHVVSMLGEPSLWRWVNPPRKGYEWLMFAEATRDMQALRYALELALLDRFSRLMRRTVEAIARTGDLALNEWALQRLFSHPRDEERGICFAKLANGPLGPWAAEFALATSRSIGRLDDPMCDSVLARNFDTWYLCGYARDNVLAEVAVVTCDQSLTEEMEDPVTRVLASAQVGIETGNPEPIRVLERHNHRASGLTELGRRRHDERLLLEACRQFDGESKDRQYLYCLSTLIDVATNPPVRPLPEQIPVIPATGSVDQLVLPLDA